MGAGGVDALGARGGERGRQFGDGARLLQRAVVPVVEHPQEGPLRPLVVFGVARAHLARPVEREADFVELLAVAGRVALGGDGRMLARLDGVLFSRKSEGVVAHRVKDVEALEPLVAGIDVRGDVAQRVADVQTRTRGVGEHVEYVVFRARRVGFDAVGSLLLPAVLPFGFNLLEIVFHISFRFVVVFPAKVRKTFRISAISGEFPLEKRCGCRFRVPKVPASGVALGFLPHFFRRFSSGRFWRRDRSCVAGRPSFCFGGRPMRCGAPVFAACGSVEGALPAAPCRALSLRRPPLPPLFFCRPGAAFLRFASWVASASCRAPARSRCSRVGRADIGATYWYIKNNDLTNRFCVLSLPMKTRNAIKLIYKP